MTKSEEIVNRMLSGKKKTTNPIHNMMSGCKHKHEVDELLEEDGEEEGDQNMVTRIKAYRKDPNNLGRGAGAYYHRGHGYYSMYSRARDKSIKSKGWQVDLIGLPKATKYPQITDGNINDYFNKMKKKKRK